jgi:hypothetical protein
VSQLQLDERKKLNLDARGLGGVTSGGFGWRRGRRLWEKGGGEGRERRVEGEGKKAEKGTV